MHHPAVQTAHGASGQHTGRLEATFYHATVSSCCFLLLAMPSANCKEQLASKVLGQPVANPSQSHLLVLNAALSKGSSCSQALDPDAVQDRGEGAQTMQVDSQTAPPAPGAAAGRPGSPPGKAPRKTPSRPAKVAHQAGKQGSAHLWLTPRS